MSASLPSEKVDLRPHHLNQLLKVAGTAAGGNQIYSDAGCRGLSVRLRGQKISWVLRYDGATYTLGWTWEGEPWHIANVKSARELAASVKAQHDFGGRPHAEEYIRLWHDNRKNELGQTHEQIVRQMRPKTNSWTLRECIAKTIADKTDPKVKKPWSDAYVGDIERTFAKEAFKTLLDTEATNLRPEDIEKVREALLKKTPSASPARKAVSAVSTVLTHCKTKYGGLSGMSQIPYPWWKEIKVDRVDEPRRRRPALTELAKTLILVDVYTSKRLPGRVSGTKDAKYGIRHAVACAFWWIALTAQRQGAGLSLERVNFVPDPKNEGWYLAAWDAASMKGKVNHVLPIPPRVVEFMQPRLANIRREDSDWMFPSERGEDDIHVNRSSTLGVLKRLAAKDEIGKNREEAVDLLAAHGIKWWTMHDVRRTITEILEDHGIPAGSSAILAHELKASERLADTSLSAESREELQKQAVARITKLAYGGAQHLKIKREAMRIWTDAVLDEVERLKGEWVPKEP
jgi:integrase